MGYLVAAVAEIEGFPADYGADDLVLRGSWYSPAHSRLAPRARYYREQIRPQKDYALGPKWLVKLESGYADSDKGSRRLRLSFA